MSTIKRSIGVRLVAALALYVLIVIISATVFQQVREPVVTGPHGYYIIFGPSLSLFTHMSYFLFALQSLFVIPWLIWCTINPEAKIIAISCFCVAWLGIGWYMHDLF